MRKGVSSHRGQHTKGSSKRNLLVILIFICALVLVYYYLIPVIFKEHVCASRNIASVEGTRNIEINVDVKELNKPYSFLIEETIPAGSNLLTSEPKPIFYDKSTGRVSWLYWKGGIPVKDGEIKYIYTGGEEVSGKVVTAKVPNNPLKGFSTASYSSEEGCA